MTARSLDRWLRERDRRAGRYDRTARFRTVALGTHGQTDWPHRLMALVGRDDQGSWSPPRVRDLYLRHNRDGSTTTTRDAVAAWDGTRKRGEEWRTFDSQDDGFTARVGYLGDDGRLHDTGLQGRRELALFRRWLLWDGWVKAEWFGLRRWLYYQGLHRAVERRVRWTCQAVPPRDSGGYQHWHCQVRVGAWGTLRRRLGQPFRHPEPHRFNNYTWTDGAARVRYVTDDPAIDLEPR